MSSPIRGFKINMAQVRRRGPNNYTITVYLGRDKDGKRKYHNETFYGGITKANLRAKELEVEFKLKRKTGPKALAMTLGEYLDEWLEVKDVSERTAEKYAWHVKRLKPLLGDLQLYNIGVFEIQKSLLNLTDVSPRTKKDIYATLRTAMRDAVKFKRLSSDPTIGLSPPRNPRIERKVLNYNELNKMLEVAKDYKHYPVIRILAVTGIRLGEVLGLKWQDVNFDKGTLTIKRSVDCRHRTIKETKTAGSVRTLKLDPVTLQILSDIKGQKVGEKVRPINLDDELTFHTEDHRPLREGAIRKTLNQALKKAGLDHIRIHDLRHTAGSILLDSGVPLATVASFLGHSTPATTASVYAHAIRGGESIAKFLESDRLADK